MIGAAKRYRELMIELLIHRELAGGDLPENEESRFVAELDRCWWAMTTAEQDDAERLLAADVDAPVELQLEDQAVSEGDDKLPRRVA